MDCKTKKSNKLSLSKLANVEQWEEVDGGFSVEDFETDCVSLESFFFEKKENPCWDGYKPVKGKKAYSEDSCEKVSEAKYQGREVSLNKPMQGDVKKSKVFVKDPSTGNVKKVNFGDPNMTIKKSNPERRKSFRARHNCDNPGPKTKARYWSCKAW
jgi:hypothetical protein